MPRTAIAILKFVGTVSLGLLTGVSYTASTQSIPALLSLPSAGDADSSFQAHKESTKRHVLALSAVSVAVFPLAFWLSPPRGGRHPYLLWTTLVTALGYGGASWIIQGQNDRAAVSAANESRDREFESYVDAAGTSSTIDISSSMELNGEEVRNSMESWRVAEIVRGGVTGLAFCMAVVGLWGDGVGARQAAVQAIVAPA